MKQKINIYSDTRLNNFFLQLFPTYDIEFYKTELVIGKQSQTNNILVTDKLEEGILNKLTNTKKKYVIICKNVTDKIPSNTNILIVKPPLRIDQITNKIKNFFREKKITFENVVVVENKLLNIKNNKSIHLTEIEKQIFLYLIEEDSCNKPYIKKNILKIKTSIETNSVESHLTRIRKKLEKIDTNIKIQSKNENLFIDIN